MKTEELIRAAVARCDRIVADADEWVGAAELRNRLVHEYPIDEAEQIDRVNDTWTASAGLIQAYATLRAQLANQGLLP